MWITIQPGPSETTRSMVTEPLSMDWSLTTTSGPPPVTGTSAVSMASVAAVVGSGIMVSSAPGAAVSSAPGISVTSSVASPTGAQAARSKATSKSSPIPTFSDFHRAIIVFLL